MSQEPTVTFEKDDGIKKQWGADKVFYRKEGKKLSINARVTAWFFGLLVVIGSCYSVVSEFFKSTPSDNLDPIIFNESLTPQSGNILVPIGTSEFNKPQVITNRPKSVVYYSAPQVIGRPQVGKIPPGIMVKAKFTTGASNGPLKAILLEPLGISDEILAPEGSILVGNGSSGEDRLTVQFSKLVFKNGKSQSIQAQACDLSDQTVGVKGKKVSKYAMLVATGAALNFLGGLTEGLQETQVQNGMPVKKSDLKNAALNGASKAALNQSQEVLTDLKNKKTVIQVDSGTEFYILFEGE